MNYMDTLPVVSLLKNGKHKAFRNLLTRANIKKDIINNTLLYYKHTMRDGDTLDIMASKYYGTPARFWMFLYGNEKLDAQWDFGMDTNIILNYIREKYCQDSRFKKYLMDKLSKNEGEFGLGEEEIRERIKEKSDEDVLQFSIDTVMEYYKIIKRVDLKTGVENIERYTTDKEHYLEDKVFSKEYTFYKYNDGNNTTTYPESLYSTIPDDIVDKCEVIKCIVTESYEKESIYDYVQRINNEKRNMHVIKEVYATAMERQVEELLGE